MFISVDVGKKVVVGTPEVVNGDTVVDDKFSVVVRKVILKISDPKRKSQICQASTMQPQIFILSYY